MFHTDPLLLVLILCAYACRVYWQENRVDTVQGRSSLGLEGCSGDVGWFGIDITFNVLTIHAGTCDDALAVGHIQLAGGEYAAGVFQFPQVNMISVASTDSVGRVQALLPDESSNMAATRWLIGDKRSASRVVAELPCEK